MFYRDPPEILPPSTLSESQGTKFLDSKFFFYHKNMKLFYGILGFFGQNLKFFAKNIPILSFSIVIAKTAQNDHIYTYIK